MKKILAVLLLICLMSFSLASCKREPAKDPNTNVDQNKPDDSNDSGEQEAQVTTVYDMLNELSKKEYETVKLDICVGHDDVTLNANYIVKETLVTYSVEKLNLIIGDIYDLPENFKTVNYGTAIVENGVIVKVEGDTVSLPEYAELVGNFNYSESYFTDATISDNKFSAKVKSVNDFLGVNSDAENMQLTVDYNESVIEKITIIYDTENAKVTSIYVFE